ncbi:MAG: nicotinate-nucleotide diphosphorylase (carboxylating), partial [Planctomycetota bacterium]
RHLEKYAARCGDAHLHRTGLHDAVLIKDNHLANIRNESLGEFVCTAAERARAKHALRFVMIEVDTLEQFDVITSIENGIDIVLLDNFSTGELQEAVARRDAVNPRLQLEASGKVTLETIAEIASTGVDRISCGAITHQAVSVDIGLDADE